jgi:hypothetical protein
VQYINVFLSYSRNDGYIYATGLQKKLHEVNISTWRDDQNLNPYSGLGYEIEQAIENASHVVVCVTQDTKRKDSYVREEINYVIRLKPRKPLIVLRFEDIPSHIGLASLPSIDFFRNWDADFNQLIYRLNLPLVIEPT